MLVLKDFNLDIEDKKLLSDVNFTFEDGKIYALMGKNGIGKSSIVKTIMGDKSYKYSGNITFNNEDITNSEIYERANKGIYLVNQMPTSIEGVTNAEMLRVALNSKNNTSVNIFEFNKELENICNKLDLDKSFIHKEINVGASGGERKKIELLHMWILKPSFIMLDEVDSGLDVDALKIITKNLKEYYEMYKPTILLITHNMNIIKEFEEYKVLVINNHNLICGDKNLAKDIMNEGFKTFDKTDIISEN